MKETILKIEHMNISFSQYGKGLRQVELPVIRDLDVEVKAGEMVAVVGSSGSGKSLLAHGVMGILPYNAPYQRANQEIKRKGNPDGSPEPFLSGSTHEDGRTDPQWEKG